LHVLNEQLNQIIGVQIFDNPELGFEEYKAHDNLVALLESLGFDVNPHAYGVHTSFSTEYGSGGRVVTFNAEYDALPGIGHACGHNLIATSSLASFLGVVSVLKQTGIPGRVRLLGTPAEEGGGGKIRLVKAGAYDDVHACFMSHAGPSQLFKAPSTGSAYGTSLSMSKFAVSFEGKPAHAAFAPYLGVNALDAVSVAYSAIGLLRQQIKQHERIHFIIKHGGDAANVIPVAATSDNQVRSGSLKELRELKARVMKCFEGAAIATGCTMESTEYVL
jgi:amidohydrolase